MKVLFSLFILLFCNLIIYAQAKIPESITKDLTLKPTPKPYESTGFMVEKGATLTILPGTKINMTIKAGEKANFPIIEIKGGLKVGAKGVAKSAPVIFEGVDPMIKFSEAELEINGMELNNYCIRFFGNTTGYVNNCSFIRATSPNSNYDFEFSVPKVGVITFQNCLIENQGIVLKSTDFPNDLENLKITNCAFTTSLNKNNKKKLVQHFVPITLFAYATKCDLYLDIEFKPFDWVFKKPVATEWYIADERFRKMTEDSVKLNKTISMKFPTKAFTNYKQIELPIEKDTKKDEKK
jgi:hypothetical protein